MAGLKIFIIAIENNKRSSKYLSVRLYTAKCALHSMYLKPIPLKSDCNQSQAKPCTS